MPFIHIYIYMCVCVCEEIKKKIQQLPTTCNLNKNTSSITAQIFSKMHKILFKQFLEMFLLENV